MRFVLASVMVLLLLPASAGAVTLVNPDGSVVQPYQEWANLSHVPTADTTITVEDDPQNCGMTYVPIACTDLANGRMYLARDADRATLYHELGHVFDAAMPEWKRQRFRRIVGLVAGAWPWSSGDQFQKSLVEAWANAYSICARGRAGLSDGFALMDGDDLLWETNRKNIARICHLIRIPNEKSPARP
jgi:hypothetical protein